MLDRSQLSIRSILKQCIGKVSLTDNLIIYEWRFLFQYQELSKITMPIAWNEPVSFLQRFTENVIYSYLLDKADECNDPVMRMQVI